MNNETRIKNNVTKIINFLSDELNTQMDTYDRISSTDCRSLIDQEKLFRVKFIKVIKSHLLILKFRSDLPIPRALGNEYNLIFLKSDQRRKGAVDLLTYNDLLNIKVFLIKGKVIRYYQDKSGEMDYIYSHFLPSDNNLDLIARVNNFEDCFVYLGETYPPVDMLNNLREFSRNHPGHCFFSYRYDNAVADLRPMHQDMTSPERLLNLCHEHSPLIIQGPPGTGKSYLISALAAKIVSINKSVLITTLANRALIEIITKDHLRELLANHKIFKYAVSTDEAESLPELQSLKKIIPVRGEIHFSTYFSASGSELILNPSLENYDYVLVDEAGQAFLPYLAATTILGKKQIFIGDINQLPPVTVLENTKIIKRDYTSAVYGLRALSSVLPSYQLTATYRLNPHSASCTQIFYKYNLESMYDCTHSLNINLFGINYSFSSGTYVISLPNDSNNYKTNSLSVVAALCYQMYDFRPESDSRKKSRIAVMSFNVTDVNSITKLLRMRMSFSNERLIIDTVHRCQGLTADFAVFLIPNKSTFSLHKEIFNVATSRAKVATFIIIPANFMDSSIEEKDQTGMFLNKLVKDNHYVSLFKSIDSFHPSTY
jgi:hypothetical protein